MPRGVYERKLTPLAVRFWKKVSKTSECWEWTANLHPKGYGYMKEGRAHRISWQLHNGPIPAGLWVLHHCDNRCCVRPDHLFLGTAKDNSEDMLRKGREARGDRSGLRLHPERVPRGTRNGHAKLTDDSVRKARHMFRSGKYWIYELAKWFGVSNATMRECVRGLTWRHLL